MRRYSVTEAPRAVLLADLAERVRREQHLNPDRPDRAEAYQRAHAELSNSGTEAMARHTLFRVANFSASTYGVTEGTREEVLAELDRYGADRAQQGKEAKARRYAEAIAQVGKGAVEVEVDRIRYRIVEG
jgi:hypothetical protein